MKWKGWRSRRKNAAARRAAASRGQRGASWTPLTGSSREVLALQRLMGNQAVRRLLAPGGAEPVDPDVAATTGAGRRLCAWWPWR